MGNESIQREVALDFPDSCLQKLSVYVDIGLPFFIARILRQQIQPSSSPIIYSLESLDGFVIRGGPCVFLRL